MEDKSDNISLSKTSPEDVIIDVRGMNCQGCVNLIESKISRIEGVKNIRVSLTENKAYIKFDPEKTSLAQIKSQINSLGYLTDGEEINKTKSPDDAKDNSGNEKIKKTANSKVLVGVVVFTLILALINSYMVFSVNSYIISNGKPTSSASGSLAAPAPLDIKETQPLGDSPSLPSKTEVSADDDAVKGSKDAPVTVIEFSDFECPFCTRFYEQTLPLIEENYIKTGKVKFVYRDFPLGFHKNAQKAAEAAECADEQGKFWEMHDKIFENQNALDIASLKQYAKDLGLDTAKFDSCLDSGKYADEVQKDFTDGQSYGVSGTPTFFINGIKVVGAQPYSAFEQIIEQELKK